MSTSPLEKKIIDYSFLFELKGCPCEKCIIKSMCTKSFVDGTACDDYKDFIIDLVEQEKLRENNNK